VQALEQVFFSRPRRCGLSRVRGARTSCKKRL
jgi:hypothetical protein